MTTTNFQNPVTFGDNSGTPASDTRAYVPGRRVLLLSQATPSARVLVPARSVVTKCSFVPTSAFTGTDPVSAMSIKFSNGTNLMADITASANTRYHESTFVSAAVLDVATTVDATLSALSTTVFTGGGGRAYIEYITEG